MADDQPTGEVPDFDAEDDAIIDAVWDRIAAEEDAADVETPRPTPDQGPRDNPAPTGRVR